MIVAGLRNAKNAKRNKKGAPTHKEKIDVYTQNLRRVSERLLRAMRISPMPNPRCSTI